MENICELFPEDKDLVEMKAEGYAGTPLRDKQGNAIGILCAITRRKLNLPPKTQEVFEIIAARAVAEIERKRSEEALKQKFDEIERMNRLMVGRELKMEELRREIKRLKDEIAVLRKAGGEP